MDQLLISADSQLSATTSPTSMSPVDERRPSIVASMLAAGVPPGSRLTYRPQHSDSGSDYLCFVQDYEVLHGELDEELMQYMPRDADAHFVTYLDAYACLAAASRTEAMQQRAQMIRRLYNDVDAVKRSVLSRIYQDISDRTQCWITRVQLHAYSARLLFYMARLDGWDANHFRRQLRKTFRKCFGPMPGNDTFDMLLDRLAHLRPVYARFLGSTSSRPLHDIAVPAAEVPDMVVEQCSICLADPGDDAVLTTSCWHQFCGECLQTWTESQQQNSMRCPMCRTRLLDELHSGRRQIRQRYLRYEVERDEVDDSISRLRLDIELHYRFTPPGPELVSDDEVAEGEDSADEYYGLFDEVPVADFAYEEWSDGGWSSDDPYAILYDGWRVEDSDDQDSDDDYDSDEDLYLTSLFSYEL